MAGFGYTPNPEKNPMAKLTDLKIKALIKSGKPFEGVSDDDCPGLYLRWPKGTDGKPTYKTPRWRFRYKIGGKARAMNLGSYETLSLSEARKVVKALRAKVTLGQDPAGEKQETKANALAKIEAAKNIRTVGQLADEYFERMIDGRLKHPGVIRARIEKDIRPALGALPVEDVKPLHIDSLLQAIVGRGAPTMANDVLRLLRRMFDYGIKRHYLTVNPASAFDISDAGGKESGRERALSLEEIAALLKAMKTAKGFSYENDIAIRLLLLLGVRKMELAAARWKEFDLEAGIWNLPAARTKTEADVSIPLPPMAIELLRELHRLACGSAYVLPARKAQYRMLPHICENTLNVALAKVEHGLEPFTVHDFRRTMRSHLGALKIPPHIAERCLNHKIKGVQGIYDRYDYLEERREALKTWAGVLSGLEDTNKVIPIGKVKSRT
jgi:integrase